MDRIFLKFKLCLLWIFYFCVLRMRRKRLDENVNGICWISWTSPPPPQHSWKYSCMSLVWYSVVPHLIYNIVRRKRFINTCIQIQYSRIICLGFATIYNRTYFKIMLKNRSFCNIMNARLPYAVKLWEGGSCFFLF